MAAHADLRCCRFPANSNIQDDSNQSRQPYRLKRAKIAVECRLPGTSHHVTATGRQQQGDSSTDDMATILQTMKGLQSVDIVTSVECMLVCRCGMKLLALQSIEHSKLYAEYCDTGWKK